MMAAEGPPLVISVSECSSKKGLETSATPSLSSNSSCVMTSTFHSSSSKEPFSHGGCAAVAPFPLVALGRNLCAHVVGCHPFASDMAPFRLPFDVVAAFTASALLPLGGPQPLGRKLAHGSLMTAGAGPFPLCLASWDAACPKGDAHAPSEVSLPTAACPKGDAHRGYPSAA